jgi:hypothetical protein
MFELFAIELFAKGPGYAKKVAGVAPRTRVIAVSRADMLSQMIHAARRGSSSVKPAGTQTPRNAAHGA